MYVLFFAYWLLKMSKLHICFLVKNNGMRRSHILSLFKTAAYLLVTSCCPGLNKVAWKGFDIFQSFVHTCNNVFSTSQSGFPDCFIWPSGGWGLSSIPTLQVSRPLMSLLLAQWLHIGTERSCFMVRTQENSGFILASSIASLWWGIITWLFHATGGFSKWKGALVITVR